MPRPRKSPIHKYTKEQFISLCEEQVSKNGWNSFTYTLIRGSEEDFHA